VSNVCERATWICLCSGLTSVSTMPGRTAMVMTSGSSASILQLIGQESVTRLEAEERKNGTTVPAEAVHHCLACIVWSTSRSSLVRRTRADENDSTTSRRNASKNACNVVTSERKLTFEMTFPLGERHLHRTNATH
jgi:hypothetical protein